MTRLAKSHAIRMRLLFLVASDNHSSDLDLGKRLGLKPRMVRTHLKNLRDDGMITIQTVRERAPTGWANYRIFSVTAAGLVALGGEQIAIR
jgi:predicted ArsR family transcriptional regulator